MVELYLSREPVFKTLNFIGREEELNWIKDCLSSQDPQNINLIGEPRIGKSSLLYNIYSAKIGLEHLERAIMILLRPVGMSERNSLAFWRAMLEQLRQEELTTSPTPKIDTSINLGTKKVRTARDLYCELEEDIHRLSEQGFQRFIFLIDDFELLFPGLGQDDLNWLRALINRYAGILAFVITSTDPLQKICREYLISTVSPFSNVFVSRQLGLLSKEEADQFINRATQLYLPGNLSKQDRRFLLSEAGRHPDLLKVACKYFLEARSKEGAQTSQEAFYDDIRSHVRYDPGIRDLCEALIIRRTVEERQILISLLDNAVDNNRILLRQLRNLTLLDQVDGDFVLFSDAFAYWVKQLINNQFDLDTNNNIGLPDLFYLGDERKAQIGDLVRELTSVEARLMDYLTNNVNRVCTTEELLKNIWGDGKSPAVVEKTVNRLRSKIELNPDKPRYILTVRGEGYILRHAKRK